MAASQAAVHQLLDIVCNAARDSNLHIADDYAVSPRAASFHPTATTDLLHDWRWHSTSVCALMPSKLVSSSLDQI